MKPRQATIVHAPVTLKLVVADSPDIPLIHGGKQFFEPFEKIVHQGLVDMSGSYVQDYSGITIFRVEFNHELTPINTNQIDRQTVTAFNHFG